jgi:hypothetical protein
MMPSSSKKQHNFMAAIANNPAFAKKVGIPQSVGRDFSNADKGKTFKKGGDTMASKMDPKMMAMMAAKKKGAMAAPAAPAGGMGGGMGMMKKGGMTKMAKGGSASARADGVASKGKTKGTQIVMSGNKGMKKGGMAC